MDISYVSDIFFISNIHKDPSDWYICLPAYLLDFAVKQMVGNYTPWSLKLTFSHLKIDGWNTISSWEGPFSGAMLVSGRVDMILP